MAHVSAYTPELWATILDRLAAGEPLTQICRDDDMPAIRSVYDWRDRDTSHAADFARAREAGFDEIAIDALHIADESGQDTLSTKDGERPDTEWISRSKLRAETRLKLLAKWDPKRYGDRQLVGSDPENPLPAGIVVSFVTPNAS